MAAVYAEADAAATATVEAEQAASAARGGPKLLDQMVAESRAAAIDIRNIVPKSKSGKSGEKENDGPLTQRGQPITVCPLFLCRHSQQFCFLTHAPFSPTPLHAP